ncbi:ganglioside GM2 activator-like [Physella acuta]|uniref:ganglioside GM2 activator-like n=1 Tax=Physella acuta TaxID=109671 RepID=UPI0027DCBFA6|nr:ganglioside GM2 activator-like [Physella acuta]
MYLCFVLAVLLVAPACGNYVEIMDQFKVEAYEEVKLLSEFLRNSTHFLDVKAKKSSKLKSFSFSNCADPGSEIATFSDVQLSPDPIHLPGKLTFSGNMDIKSKFGAPLKAQLEVSKKFGFIWMPVPCIHDVGSCTYDDLCSKINIKTCPEDLKKLGLDCHCPFPSGDFKISALDIEIGQSLPVTGEFKIKATISYNGDVVTCAEMEFDVE